MESLNGSRSTSSVPIQAVSATEPKIKEESDNITLASVPVMKTAGPPRKSVCSVDQSFWASAQFDSGLDYEACVVGTILSQIGDRPIKPLRAGVNPFLLFTKEKWEECKDYCANDPKLANGRNIIRTTLGIWWKALTPVEKEPYMVQSQQAQEVANTQQKEYEAGVVKWDADAARIRQEYMRENPPPEGAAGSGAFGSMGLQGAGVSKRKTNVSANVGLDMSRL